MSAGWRKYDLRCESLATQTAVCALLLVILSIQLAACTQSESENEKGKGSREPGAQVTFGIDLAGNPYLDEQVEIAIDGKLIASVKNGGQESVFLPKGDYRIRISAEGFEPIEREISVKDSPTQTFRFTLHVKR
jgi:hypothetical protein